MHKLSGQKVVAIWDVDALLPCVGKCCEQVGITSRLKCRQLQPCSFQTNIGTVTNSGTHILEDSVVMQVSTRGSKLSLLNSNLLEMLSRCAVASLQAIS